MRNQYVQQCAKLVDRALRAHGSFIQPRMWEYLRQRFGVQEWGVASCRAPAEEIPPPTGAGPRGFFGTDVKEEWFVHTLGEVPVTPEAFRTPSIFCTSTGGIREHPEYRDRAFRFGESWGWLEIGTSGLLAAGWRSDRTWATERCVERLTPPPIWPLRPLLVGAAGAIEWMPLEEQHWVIARGQVEGATLAIEVETWNMGDLSATVTYLRSPDGEVETQ